MAQPRQDGPGRGPTRPDTARRRCAHCREWYAPRTDHQQFCSQPCASRHRWCGGPGRVCPSSGQAPQLRPDPAPPRTYAYKGHRPALKRCVHCAGEFRPSLANPKQQLCSPSCSSRHRACKDGRRACPAGAHQPLDVTIS
jgi:hypothetical protein